MYELILELFEKLSSVSVRQLSDLTLMPAAIYIKNFVTAAKPSGGLLHKAPLKYSGISCDERLMSERQQLTVYLVSQTPVFITAALIAEVEGQAPVSR
jgi:hypothetical protein